MPDPVDMNAMKQQLIAHEALRLKPYKDTVGKLTIGVGRNLDDRGISREEAMVLLNNDIGLVVADLDRTFPWWSELTENRKRVLIDMAFNLGISGLSGFHKALAAMESGEYTDAASEMLDSRWAVQVGDRAQSLAAMMREG